MQLCVCAFSACLAVCGSLALRLPLPLAQPTLQLHSYQGDEDNELRRSCSLRSGAAAVFSDQKPLVRCREYLRLRGGAEEDDGHVACRAESMQAEAEAA